jgi:hypothetical protein
MHLFGGFPKNALVDLPGANSLDASDVRSRGLRFEIPRPHEGPLWVVGTRGGYGPDLAAARDLAVRGAIDLSPLVSHVVSLEAAPSVLDELCNSQTVSGVRALRVVIDLALSGTVALRVDQGALPRMGA